MKRLIVTLEYPPQVGGIASYVFNFLSHVSKDDFVVYAPAQPGDQEFDQKQAWKTYRHKAYYPFWPRWMRMFLQILRIVVFEDIKEVYVHQVLPAGYAAWLLKRFKKIPYTVFLHGTDVIAGTKSKWKEMWFTKVLLGADKVVANSHFLEKKVKSVIDNIGDIKIIYPCPNDNFLKAVPEEQVELLKNKLALNGKKVVLTVSRMVDGKGYPHIIRLLSAISSKVPNLVWLFIGDGPKKKTIMDLVQKNNLQNIVRFLGALPNDQLPQYYHSADLFVLLSHQDQEAEESWGGVYLEAAACGVPVVAGRVGGVDEAVEHLRTGVIVDVYHEKSVVSSIVDLLNNKNFAEELGKAGKERVEREFLWEKQINKL